MKHIVTLNIERDLHFFKFSLQFSDIRCCLIIVVDNECCYIEDFQSSSLKAVDMNTHKVLHIYLSSTMRNEAKFSGGGGILMRDV